jgi:hypothetical protein
MRSMRLAPLLALAPALGVAGCNGGVSAKGSTSMVAVALPAGFMLSDLGQSMLPLHTLPAGAAGGRFVVASAALAGVAVVDVDAHGEATAQNVDMAALPGTLPIGSLAEVPGTDRVLMGVPDRNGGTIAVMTLGATPDVAVFDKQVAARYGLAVAAGNLAGTDAPDFVVVSGAELDVYVDGDAQKRVTAPADPKCPLDLGGGQTVNDPRRVVVAPLVAGAGSEQIAVGTPLFGTVSVFTVDATGAAKCAFAYTNNDTNVTFGAALATGDFDGDGAVDLLIGAPRDQAFWIKGPLTAASPVLPVALAPSSAARGNGALGASLAAGNFDGAGGDEALVGDFAASVGGAMIVGEVRVVRGAALDQEVAPLRSPAPAAGDDFGIQVAALPFCTSGCGTAAAVVQALPLIASSTRAFVDFTFGPADPRMP